MQDLIDFEKGTASASTPAKPTNFLIDYNFDDMDTAATPAAVAESNKVVEAQEATHAWEKYVKAAQETKKRVPVIDGPFNKAGSDEFEEMWKAKMAGEHDISMYSFFSSFSSFLFPSPSSILPVPFSVFSFFS